MSNKFKKIRLAYAKKMCEILTKYNTENKMTQNKINKFALDLEKNILLGAKNTCKKSGYLIYKDTTDTNTYTKAFYGIYEGIIRRIILNIDKESYVKNIDLIEKIYDEILTPSSIVQMSIECPQTLFSSRHQEIFDEIEKQEDARYNSSNLKISSEYKCKKCKSKKCIVNLAQLRSADESMSTLITCLDCGNKWRIG